MLFDSYNKKQFEVGKTYWTYFSDETNRGNALKDYTGIFQVRVGSYDKEDKFYDFIVLNNHQFTKTMSHNIHAYLNGYGISFCYFSEDKDEIIKHHDDYLKKFAKKQNTKDRTNILKKLINKEEEPLKSQLEMDSVNWFNGLTAKEKKYVKWIKKYYEEI